MTADPAREGFEAEKVRCPHGFNGTLKQLVRALRYHPKSEGRSSREIKEAAAWLLEQQAALASAGQQQAEAYRYLENVFKICAPQCKPLPTLLGLCTQIDNLIAGYRIDAGQQQARVAELEGEVERLRKALREIATFLDEDRGWRSFYREGIATYGDLDNARDVVRAALARQAGG